MEELYNTDTEQINQEIDHVKKNELLQVKLELLQIYQMCYMLYKETESQDIYAKLIKITNLLRKFNEMENNINDITNIEDKDTNKRLLKDIEKKKYKKIKGSNPRKKFKDKNEKLNETCKKVYDGKI